MRTTPAKGWSARSTQTGQCGLLLVGGEVVGDGVGDGEGEGGLEAEVVVVRHEDAGSTATEPRPLKTLKLIQAKSLK